MQVLSEIVASGLSRLRTRNPLAAVAAEHGVVLVPRGRVLVGRCPFERRLPVGQSFTVWPGLGRYECCECGLSGDVIGFVIWAERTNFVTAIRLLCQRAGMSEGEVLRFVDVAGRPEQPPRLLCLDEWLELSEVPSWPLTPSSAEPVRPEVVR